MEGMPSEWGTSSWEFKHVKVHVMTRGWCVELGDRRTRTSEPEVREQVRTKQCLVGSGDTVYGDQSFNRPSMHISPPGHCFFKVSS